MRRGRLPLIGLLTSACNGLFYYPTNELHETPAAVGAKFDDLSIPSTDGVTLRAWKLRPRGPARGVIVHFHGNAENMTTHYRYVAWLAEAGYFVVTFDYRGYGASTGEPSREGMVDDGMAVLAHVARDPELRGLDRFVIGQSLGGAIAIPSLVRSEGQSEVRAIVIDGSFASYRGVAWSVVKGSPFLWLAAPAVLLVSGDLDPADDVGKLARPLLVIHGDADEVVPLAQGEALFAAALEPREMWTVPGGGHLTALAIANGPHRARLLAYLEAHASQGR